MPIYVFYIAGEPSPDGKEQVNWMSILGINLFNAQVEKDGELESNWNSNAIILVSLKFLALLFVHIQEQVFKSDEFHKFR